MARNPTTDTVTENGVEEQLGKKDERSELHRCEICQFLVQGFRKAHSVQAKNEYGSSFLTHVVTKHVSLLGELS